MKTLNKKKCSFISGSQKWSCEFSDYQPNYILPTESQIDYTLMGILVGNAAIFGCLNGMRTGGIYGCVAGGSIAGVGTMYAMIAADSYKMYQENKK